MVQRTGFAQGHADHLALGLLGCLADGFRHFACLAMTEADAALLIPNDDERGKTEPPAALHHLGDAIDVHQAIYKLAVALLKVFHRSYQSSLSIIWFGSLA